MHKVHTAKIYKETRYDKNGFYYADFSVLRGKLHQFKMPASTSSMFRGLGFNFWQCLWQILVFFWQIGHTLVFGERRVIGHVGRRDPPIFKTELYVLLILTLILESSSENMDCIKNKVSKNLKYDTYSANYVINGIHSTLKCFPFSIISK